MLTPVDSSGASGLTAASEAIRAVGSEPFPIASAVTGQKIKNDSISGRYEVPRETLLELIKLNEPYDSAFLAVAPVAAEEIGTKVVVDPVLKTSYGAELQSVEDARKTIKGAYVITPNFEEALKLSGTDNLEDALEALSEYSEWVIVKNVSGKDVIRTPHGRLVEVKPRTPAVGYRDLRGTGTLYAATIAGLLAEGYNVVDSAREAKRLVEISSALSVYTGSRKVDTLVYLRSKKIEKETRETLEEYVYKVSHLKYLPALLPEVGSNFAYALPRAADKNDVYGLTGRMVRSKKPPRVFVAGEVKLGGSSHLGRAIVRMMRDYPEMRACMNIRFDERLVKILEEKFLVSFYDRLQEPKEIKSVDGQTTQRGIGQAIERGKEKYGNKPLDIVYHRGDRGKEPMILIFGRDPEDIYIKVNAIIELVKNEERFINRYRALSRVCILGYAF